MNNMLVVNCEEWRVIAETYPEEMEVIIEMMIEADEQICIEYDEAA
jgi:hypothetical protein